jgi:DNA polymerase-3 subunit alpha
MPYYPPVLGEEILAGRELARDAFYVPTPELYFKSTQEIRALFDDLPEAITNTVEIAERCNLKLEFGGAKFPEYAPPVGKTRERYLRELCREGLRKRYGERAVTEAELIKRLEHEIGILEKTGFVSYFLIVWDFIHFAKERGIPVGPGRGSAAGSTSAFQGSLPKRWCASARPRTVPKNPMAESPY